MSAYKTACAQSMRGKKDKALKALKNAVAEGYKDIKEMEKDTNLDNIRDTVSPDLMEDSILD
jgi:hypothetical protein